MYCLGIESTAHTFGASIVSFDGEIKSNERKLYTTNEGGLIPAKLAEHHVDVCDEIISQALSKAQLNMSDISLVSFSQSPGLGHSLRIGASAARSLSLRNNIPLIGVNHCVAHLEIGRLLTSAKDPVLLYASGANTQVIAYEGKKYRVFGETLDIGIGNFLDSFGRLLKLGFPGGPKIQELAKQGKKLIKLPYNVKGMDANFGGILTKLKSLIGKESTEDLCFSAQETVFAMLLEISERAMAHTGKNELLLGGGVACNTRLQEMARQMCKDRGAECHILENQYNVDNAAMIAWLGVLQFKSGQQTKISDSSIQPYLRTDEIDVTWRD